MVEYTKINCKLTNVQLNKFKKSVKSNEGATLRLGIKNFNKDELPHELFLTTRQNTKQRLGSLRLGSTLGASSLGNLLTGGKVMMRVGEGIVRAGDGIARAGEGSKKNPKFTITISSINKYRNK